MLFLLFCQKISWHWIIVAKQWFPKWRFRNCKYNESLNISNGWNSISTSRSSGVIRRMPSVSKSMQPSPRLCPCKPLPPLRTGWAGMPSQSQVRHRRTSGGSSGDTTKHRWRCTNKRSFPILREHSPASLQGANSTPLHKGIMGNCISTPEGTRLSPKIGKNKSFRYTKLNNSGTILLNIK